jgi:hypothetical protein
MRPGSNSWLGSDNAQTKTRERTREEIQDYDYEARWTKKKEKENTERLERRWTRGSREAALRLCEVETYPKGASATTTFQPQSRAVPIASIGSNQGACFKLVRSQCAWVVRVSVRLDKASQLPESRRVGEGG